MKRLPDPVQQKVLLGVVAILFGIAALFAVPAANEAVIGLFWFPIKVSVIVYLMIWFRAALSRATATISS